MNKTLSESVEFIEQIKQEIHSQNVWIAPAFCHLHPLKKQFPTLYFGAQNISAFEKGAYTGEVSSLMLKDIQTDFCIIGHSERRHIFHENDADIAKKIFQSVKERIFPILCVGETVEEKKQGKTLEVIQRQLQEGLSLVKEHQFSFMIAYEPVWAIGSSLPATPSIAEEVLAQIKKLAIAMVPSCSVKFLYGGSVTLDNIDSYLEKDCIDGVLVGGASLDINTFKNLLK
jgi:triosephosphate isomerase